MAYKGSICFKSEVHKYRIRKLKALSAHTDWCVEMANSPNLIFLWSNSSALDQLTAFTRSAIFSTSIPFRYKIRSCRSFWESGTLVMPTQLFDRYLFFLLWFGECQDFWMNEIDEGVLKFQQFLDQWVWRCWHFEANSIWKFINPN